MSYRIRSEREKQQLVEACATWCGEVRMSYRIRSEREQQQLVEAWRRWGLPKTRFARENGLPPTSFTKWIEASTVVAHVATRCVPVHVVDEAVGPSGPLVARVARRGHRVEVPAGFDPLRAAAAGGHAVLIPGHLRVRLAAEPASLLKPIDGLCGEVERRFPVDPMTGHVFVFVNRAHTGGKLLHWGHGGFVLTYKRLGRGRFAVPVTLRDRAELTGTRLAALAEGIDLSRARRVPMWKPAPPS